MCGVAGVGVGGGTLAGWAVSAGALIGVGWAGHRVGIIGRQGSRSDNALFTYQLESERARVPGLAIHDKLT